MHSDRLLKESVEEHSPGSRPSAVKLVQVGLPMIRTEGTWVGAEQPPFHKGRHAVDSGENFVRVHARALDGSGSMNIVIPRCQWDGGQSVVENPGAGLY